MIRLSKHTGPLQHWNSRCTRPNLSPGPTMVPPKLTGINDQLIDLIDSKQTLYNPIYSLELVELKILKTYVEINLANAFIRSSKSQVENPILFLPRKKRKPLGYVLTLVGKSLDYLGRTRRCVSSSWIWQTYTMGRKLVKATNWRQSSGPVTVVRVSNHALSNTRFKDPG